MTRELPYLRRVFQLCAALSISFGFVGIVLYAASGAHADSPIFLGDTFQGMLLLDPVSIILAGILVLIISPIIWVATALIAFIRNKDTFYACLGLVILVLMSASLMLTS
ncbi:MAG: DUF1634 domain-containing protein [Halobacteriota archaeon]